MNQEVTTRVNHEPEKMIEENKLLKNKIALVTGASRGIGKSIAQTFANAGADLAICARNENLLQKISKDIAVQGRRCLVLTTDVTNELDIQTAVKKTLDTYGRVDILVNNAGVVRDNLIARMKSEEWDVVLSTNLKSAFLFTGAIAKHMMRQRSGRIINITSIIGVIGNAGQANYAASKGGLIGLTKSAARELASRNILVNAIAPGFIVTEMTQAMTSEQRDMIFKNIPLARFGNPEDIAQVALFLASERSRYITGQVIHVDGGMVM